jgi:excisionase family DNA binding protein
MIIYATISISMNQVAVPHQLSGISSLHQDLDLLTLPEAAALLKVSVVTLRRWIKQGRLPAYYVGPRKVRINRSDLSKAFTPTMQKYKRDWKPCKSQQRLLSGSGSAGKVNPLLLPGRCLGKSGKNVPRGYEPCYRGGCQCFPEVGVV